MMDNIFRQEVAESVVERLNQLTPQTQPKWGKMSVDQMLAHCNVPYDMVYEPQKFKRPGAFGRGLIQLFAKQIVVGNKPYKKNSRTAPDFIISDKRNFEVEKQKLINHIMKTADLGEDHFDGKESFALGVLSKNQWNNLFHKHIDHHLQQFDV